MKNTRYAIFLASFIALLSFTACGEVGDKPAPKTTKADSSSVIDSSSVVDSKQDDSSSSDSKTTTTASSKETTSVTTTSIVVLKDGKGNIVTQFAVDENGRTISLGKDSKTTTKKSGSGSSSSGKTSTKKTSNGSSNNTTGSVIYQTNSGGSSGYSSGDSGYSDNGGYSYDDGGNSGSSGGSSGGSGSSGGGAVNTTTTTTTAVQDETYYDIKTLDGYGEVDKDFCGFVRCYGVDYKRMRSIGENLSYEDSEYSKAKAVCQAAYDQGGVNCINYALNAYFIAVGAGLECYVARSTKYDWYGHTANIIKIDGDYYYMEPQGNITGVSNTYAKGGIASDGSVISYPDGLDKVMDIYGNYYDLSISETDYLFYPLHVNGHGIIHVGISEEDAIAYHKYGTIPGGMEEEAKFWEEHWDEFWD